MKKKFVFHFKHFFKLICILHIFQILAFVRFAICIVFYALFDLKHWWPIAVSNILITFDIQKKHKLMNAVKYFMSYDNFQTHTFFNFRLRRQAPVSF
jgi:hypothetical protein